jgi:hypothetical protein
MNRLLACFAAAALMAGCATPPAPAVPAAAHFPNRGAVVGGPPNPGDAIAAELGFHGPVAEQVEQEDAVPAPRPSR